MSTEMKLLKNLVFSQSFRSALSEMTLSQRIEFLKTGWGATVGFLDLGEVEKFARLSMKTLTAGPDRGNTLSDSYKNTLAMLENSGLKREAVFYRFFESKSFVDFREIQGNTCSISIEEAFYRFVASELIVDNDCKELRYTLDHESLHCIARGLTTLEISPESVRHPLMKSTGCGMGGIMKSRPSGRDQDQSIDNSYTFCFGGKSFVRGEIQLPVVKVLRAAMQLNEPNSAIRRAAMFKCFPSSLIVERLIKIGVI